LVELAVGILILVLGTLEVLQAGANLPPAFGRIGQAANISWLIHHPNWDVVLVCILHGTLLCILFSWALIQYDGHPVPPRYLLLALVLIAAFPLSRPSLQAVPWITEAPAILREPLWFSQRISTLAGLGTGVFVGLALAGAARACGATPQIAHAGRTRDGTFALGLVGMALGWQAVLSVALLATIASLLGPRLARQRLGQYGSSFLLYVFLATAAQVYLWGALEQLAWWPNSQAGPVTMAVTLVGILLLACLASLQVHPILRDSAHSG
jgi:hypothetical protein